MPSKKLTDTARRADMWFADPYEIHLAEDLSGRKYPPTPEDVVKRAVSMLKHGQLQAVEVRRSSNQIVLVSGFTRAKAARLIRDGFEYEGQPYRDQNFMLACRVVTVNEKEAFEHNIVENYERNETSPIDNAHNHRRLRESYGYSDADICRLYGMDDSVVSRLKKLLELDDDTQLLVHQRLLAVNTAISLLELPEKERKAAIKAAMLENGKVSSESVRKQVRDRNLEQTEATEDKAEEPKSKYVKRSTKEVVKFLTEAREEVNPKAQPIIKRLIEFINGRCSDKTLIKAIAEAFS